MNLNEIRLPATVIADLYKNSLIALTVNTNTSSLFLSEEVLPDPLQYLGNNLKQILIAVYYPDQTFLPDDQLRFLNAVLKACNLTQEDTAIVNFATFKPDYNLLKRQLLPQVMLFFGDRAKFITISGNATEFEQIKLEEITTLFIPELERLNQDNNEGKILKKKLWSALKHLFSSNGD